MKTFKTTLKSFYFIFCIGFYISVESTQQDLKSQGFYYKDSEDFDNLEQIEENQSVCNFSDNDFDSHLSNNDDNPDPYNHAGDNNSESDQSSFANLSNEDEEDVIDPIYQIDTINSLESLKKELILHLENKKIFFIKDLYKKSDYKNQLMFFINHIMIEENIIKHFKTRRMKRESRKHYQKQINEIINQQYNQGTFTDLFTELKKYYCSIFTISDQQNYQFLIDQELQMKPKVAKKEDQRRKVLKQRIDDIEKTIFMLNSIEQDRKIIQKNLMRAVHMLKKKSNDQRENEKQEIINYTKQIQRKIEEEKRHEMYKLKNEIICSYDDYLEHLRSKENILQMLKKNITFMEEKNGKIVRIIIEKQDLLMDLMKKKYTCMNKFILKNIPESIENKNKTIMNKRKIIVKRKNRVTQNIHKKNQKFFNVNKLLEIKMFNSKKLLDQEKKKNHRKKMNNDYFYTQYQRRIEFRDNIIKTIQEFQRDEMIEFIEQEEQIVLIQFAEQKPNLIRLIETNNTKELITIFEEQEKSEVISLLEELPNNKTLLHNVLKQFQEDQLIKYLKKINIEHLMYTLTYGDNTPIFIDKDKLEEFLENYYDEQSHRIENFVKKLTKNFDFDKNIYIIDWLLDEDQQLQRDEINDFLQELTKTMIFLLNNETLSDLETIIENFNEQEDEYINCLKKRYFEYDRRQDEKDRLIYRNEVTHRVEQIKDMKNNKNQEILKKLCYIIISTEKQQQERLMQIEKSMGMFNTSIEIFNKAIEEISKITKDNIEEEPIKEQQQYEDINMIETEEIYQSNYITIHPYYFYKSHHREILSSIQQSQLSIFNLNYIIKIIAWEEKTRDTKLIMAQKDLDELKQLKESINQNFENVYTLKCCKINSDFNNIVMQINQQTKDQLQFIEKYNYAFIQQAHRIGLSIFLEKNQIYSLSDLLYRLKLINLLLMDCKEFKKTKQLKLLTTLSLQKIFFIENYRQKIQELQSIIRLKYLRPYFKELYYYESMIQNNYSNINYSFIFTINEKIQKQLETYNKQSKTTDINSKNEQEKTIDIIDDYKEKKNLKYLLKILSPYSLNNVKLQLKIYQKEIVQELEKRKEKSNL